MSRPLERSVQARASAGIEPPRIWGFPKKYAHPKLEIVKDTLTGTLAYAGQLVAMGTMGYKHESMAGNDVRQPGRGRVIGENRPCTAAFRYVSCCTKPKFQSKNRSPFSRRAA